MDEARPGKYIMRHCLVKILYWYKLQITSLWASTGERCLEEITYTNIYIY